MNATMQNWMKIGWLVEWGFYALSASKAIFRARTLDEEARDKKSPLKSKVSLTGQVVSVSHNCIC